MGRAAQLHRKGWTKKLMALADEDSPYVKSFAKLVELTGHVGLGQDVLLLAYLWQSGMTWSNAVQDILMSTSGIDMSTALGSSVQAWAEKKAWLVAHTLATPRATSKESVH